MRIVRRDGAAVRLYTRKGNNWTTKLPPIVAVAEQIKAKSFTIDGEAVVLASTLVRIGFINGLSGFVTLEADGELQTTTLDIEGGRITTIYVVRYPDKLRHLH